MTTNDDRPRDATSKLSSLSAVALFASIWFVLLWLLIGFLAAYSYRVGQATPFRYVGF